MTEYYVYVHYKETTGEPFYVGKGKGNRAFEFSGKNRNVFWKRVHSKHGVVVKFYKENLTEKEALSLEIKLVFLYRHMGFILTNLTEGGEGVSGYRFTDDQLLNISKGVTSVIGTIKTKKEVKRKRSKGLLNHNSDKTVYSFYRLEDGFIFKGTRTCLEDTFGLEKSQIKKLFYKNNPRKSACGWKLYQGNL